jgi:hypothetical protein
VRLRSSVGKPTLDWRRRPCLALTRSAGWCCQLLPLGLSHAKGSLPASLGPVLAVGAGGYPPHAQVGEVLSRCPSGGTGGRRPWSRRPRTGVSADPKWRRGAGCPHATEVRRQRPAAMPSHRGTVRGTPDDKASVRSSTGQEPNDAQFFWRSSLSRGRFSRRKKQEERRISQTKRKTSTKNKNQSRPARS